MATRSLLATAVAVAAGLLLSGCPFACVEDRYAFQVGFQATPEQATLSVGDTLWLEAHTPTSLHDTNTGSTVDFSGADLVVSMRISALTPDSATLLDAAHYFDFLVVEGEPRRRDDWQEERFPNTARNFAFSEIKGDYRFRGALVARQAGSYLLALTGGGGAYRRQKGSCQRASFTYLFTNADRHLEDLQRYYYQGVAIPERDQITAYGFRVLE